MTPHSVGPRGGRPKDPAKYEAIIAAAQRRFTQEPYDRVSMDDIAVDADVSKVTIYSHFPNKDALFVAAISKSCESVFGKIDLSAPESEPIDSVLYQLGCDFLAMICDPDIDRLHAVIMSEGQNRPELPQLFYDTAVRRSTDTLANYLKAQVERGILNVRDPYTAAVQFIALVQGEFRFKIDLGLAKAGRDDMDAYVGDCVGMVLRAWRV